MSRAEQISKISILDVPIFSGNISEVVNLLFNTINKKVKTNQLITATNAHGLVISKKDKRFKDILCESFLNLPDGMPTVWLGRLKGMKEMERCYGPDFFAEAIKKTSGYKINHFLCGGKDGTAVKLQEFCCNVLNNSNIVGTYSPPFTEMNNEEINELADKINSLNTDILWLGLSCPKQELLAYKLKKNLNVHFIVTVGAAFDFHTGNVKQAPKWIQNAGLEWLFRLLMEPKRLWKRYFTVVPLFIFYNLQEFIQGKFLSQKTA